MLLSQQRRLEREFRRLEERAKKWQHGGQCVRAGAPPGNQNARKSQLMPTPWPEKLAEKMGQPEGFWAFLP